MKKETSELTKEGWKLPTKIVKYRDSNIYNGQVENQEFEVAILFAAGFVLRENKDKIVLAQEIIGDGYRQILVIPKENILSTTRT